MSDNTGKRIAQCKTHRKRSKGHGNHCRIKQGNELHSVKLIEKGQKVMQINVG